MWGFWFPGSTWLSFLSLTCGTVKKNKEKSVHKSKSNGAGREGEKEVLKSFKKAVNLVNLLAGNAALFFFSQKNFTYFFIIISPRFVGGR